jgi:hypothetical protein
MNSSLQSETCRTTFCNIDFQRLSAEQRCTLMDGDCIGDSQTVIEMNVRKTLQIIEYYNILVIVLDHLHELVHTVAIKYFV